MRAIRSTDTRPERLIRSLLHRAGYRFRKNVRDVPGSPDLAIKRRKKAVFVHGCFWHQHSGCRHAKMPRIRTEYWVPKLQRVMERDQKNIADLEAAGWQTLTVWECELQCDLAGTFNRVTKFLGPASNS
jgi:DNA mismatch endonuclease (patch repair protein)